MLVYPNTQRSPLAAPRRRTSQEAIGIIGGGNSARALAGYLSRRGHEVRLLVRSPEKVAGLDYHRAVRVIGHLEGYYPVKQVTTEPDRFFGDCRTLFVATTTDAYPELCRRYGPYLEAGHQVILFSSKFGGSALFEHGLAQQRRTGVRVIETDALFACRAQGDDAIWIRGIKRWTYYSCPRQSQTRQAAALMANFFPGLEPAENLVQRGLTDFGALAHALTVLVNMNSIDRGKPFLFYYEGFTENTVVLLESMEREFQRVAQAYGTSLIPAAELLNRYYGGGTGSLLEAIRQVPNYRHSVAPDTLRHRYLTEDVPCTLVPVQQLARLAGVATPMIDSVINLSSVLSGRDFASTGRSLSQFGWSGLKPRQIVDWMAR
ncbi:MAG: NAD/NADP octopine/nopaline dehydrogenase family protein [Vulcanimicrobiota bacterium]